MDDLLVGPAYRERYGLEDFVERFIASSMDQDEMKEWLVTSPIVGYRASLTHTQRLDQDRIVLETIDHYPVSRLCKSFVLNRYVYSKFSSRSDSSFDIDGLTIMSVVRGMRMEKEEGESDVSHNFIAKCFASDVLDSYSDYQFKVTGYVTGLLPADSYAQTLREASFDDVHKFSRGTVQFREKVDGDSMIYVKLGAAHFLWGDYICQVDDDLIKHVERVDTQASVLFPYDVPTFARGLIRYDANPWYSSSTYIHKGEGTIILFKQEEYRLRAMAVTEIAVKNKQCQGQLVQGASEDGVYEARLNSDGTQFLVIRRRYDREPNRSPLNWLLERPPIDLLIALMPVVVAPIQEPKQELVPLYGSKDDIFLAKGLADITLSGLGERQNGVDLLPTVSGDQATHILWQGQFYSMAQPIQTLTIVTRRVKFTVSPPQEGDKPYGRLLARYYSVLSYIFFGLPYYEWPKFGEKMRYVRKKMNVPRTLGTDLITPKMVLTLGFTGSLESMTNQIRSEFPYASFLSSDLLTILEGFLRVGLFKCKDQVWSPF